MLSLLAAGPLGWRALCGFLSLSTSTMLEIPTQHSAKKIFTFSRKLGKSASTVCQGRCSIPRSMRELLPGFEKEAPLDAEVAKESVYFLTEKGKFKFPVTPPPLRDHGNYVISLNRFVKWLGSKVESAGITVFTGFAGSQLLFDGDRVTGVRTDDKGVDKQNQPKSNFEPGHDLNAKIVILAEGPRGSLTKQLIT